MQGKDTVINLISSKTFPPSSWAKVMTPPCTFHSENGHSARAKSEQYPLNLWSSVQEVLFNGIQFYHAVNTISYSPSEMRWTVTRGETRAHNDPQTGCRHIPSPGLVQFRHRHSSQNIKGPLSFNLYPVVMGGSREVFLPFKEIGQDMGTACLPPLVQQQPPHPRTGMD